MDFKVKRSGICRGFTRDVFHHGLDGIHLRISGFLLFSFTPSNNLLMNNLALQGASCLDGVVPSIMDTNIPIPGKESHSWKISNQEYGVTNQFLVGLTGTN